MRLDERKRIMLLFCAFVFACGALLFTVVSKSNCAYAETECDLSAERYTSSDKLLNPDGTESEQTIQMFAENVKIAKHLDLTPDIIKVMPTEYLETDESEAEYSFMGSEYGFYILKKGDFFYVLLIDFVYDFGEDEYHSDLEFKIRVEPILQQCFRRYKSEIGCQWVKINDESYKFYVLNPRFVTALFNENALNYNDIGYSKQTDEGLIISQIRCNYQSVSLATANDYLKVVNKYVAEQGFGIACTILDLLPVKIGTIFNGLKDAVDLADELFDVNLEKKFTANNEQNIETSMSKTQQQEDEAIDHYSRGCTYQPMDKIILSTANNSYAELITVINDSNFRSRIVQVCEFDIAYTRGASGDIEFVTVPNNKNAFSAYKQRTIFADREPNFVIGEDFNSEDISVYMLPDGEQSISFTPKYSGWYSFNVPAEAELSLCGIEKDSFFLQCGQKYDFILSNKTNTIVDGRLSCRLKSFMSNEDCVVEPYSNYMICYQSNSTEYMKIESSNSNLKIEVLDEHLNKLASSVDGYAYAHFFADKSYYFLLINETDSSEFAKIDLTHVKSISFNQDYSVSQNDKVVEFKNDNDYYICYKLRLSDISENDIIIVDNNGKNIISTKQYIEDCVECTFALGAQESCYISFNKLEGMARIEKMPAQCRWLVDGYLSNSFNIRLKPNATYEIKAEISFDGETFLYSDNIAVSAMVESCMFIGGRLKIDDVANNCQIILIPDNLVEFSLTVTVDDFITVISLNHCGGIGYDGEIKVELNCSLPSDLALPIKKGYRFKGYFTSKQDSLTTGKQYYSDKMEGACWDIDVDTITLFAHWEQLKYTLTFDNGIGCDKRYDRYTMNYGEVYPTFDNLAPMQAGYTFLGYFDDDGVQYYAPKSELSDNRLLASKYGYAHYFVEGIELCYNENIWLFERDITLYARWQKMYCIYYFKHYIEGKGVTTSTRISLVHQKSVSITAPKVTNGEFKHFQLGNEILTESTIMWVPSLMRNPLDGEIVPTEELVAVYSQSSCIAAGSLITLADGRQVPVETLTGSEMLLVWNLQTGTFDSAKILFIDKDPAKLYKVVNLGFSDGTNVKVISEHAFWDFDLNKYVYLDENASSYIGHYFNKQITNADGSIGYGRVQLVSVDIRDEYTTSYSPVTYGHLCYYVNGMLSVPGGITGLFNIFEVDAETMTVNAELMEQDVLRYGLFTYEEFATFAPISEEAFNAFNGQYLKVAIGKGLITADDLQMLVARYADFLEEI